MKAVVGVALAVLAVAGCVSDELDNTPDGPWVGTITTEGNVTTVINESGSVWGGTATLVEEASIGVEAGAQEYMFGTISAVHASPERIYVVDIQVPVIRMYDHSGGFLGNLGSEGQGPGEYTRPSLVTTDAAGRAFVLAYQLARINVYSPEGEPVETWPFSSSWCCSWPMFPAGDGRLWAPVRGELDEGIRVYRGAAQHVGSEGPEGQATWMPKVDVGVVTYAFEGWELFAPLSPREVWTPTPDGGIAFRGSNQYRYDILRSDGTRLIVSKYWDPTPIPAAQREWARRLEVAQNRTRQPDWDLDGAEIPRYKSPMGRLVPALSGEIWVIREGESRSVAGCVEDLIEAGVRAARERPCWESALIVDVFGQDGRFLGSIDPPPGMRFPPTRPYIDGDLVIARVEDEAGTIMVKRYRLMLPGEER